MKRSAKTLLLSGAAAMLVAGMAVTPSMSYFTTYVEAKGSIPIQIEEVIPEFEEKYEGGVKTITASNTGKGPCYVRVRAFAGSEVKLSYEVLDNEWFDGGDGYYYYYFVLQPGESATELRIVIDDGDLKRDYNVTVVMEAAPIFYDEAGNVVDLNGPDYVGWNLEKDEHIVHIEETYGENGKVEGEQP